MGFLKALSEQNQVALANFEVKDNISYFTCCSVKPSTVLGTVNA